MNLQGSAVVSDGGSAGRFSRQGNPSQGPSSGYAHINPSVSAHYGQVSLSNYDMRTPLTLPIYFRPYFKANVAHRRDTGAGPSHDLNNPVVHQERQQDPQNFDPRLLGISQPEGPVGLPNSGNIIDLADANWNPTLADLFGGPCQVIRSEGLSPLFVLLDISIHYRC